MIVLALGGVYLFGGLHLASAPPAAVAAKSLAFTGFAQLFSAWLFAPWAVRTEWVAQFADACVFTLLFLPMFALCMQMSDVNLSGLGLLQLGAVAAFTVHGRLVSLMRRRLTNPPLRSLALSVTHWAPLLVLVSYSERFAQALAGV